MTIEPSKIYETEMSATQFQKLSSYIKNICGINLTDEKKTMVESRLRKRVRELGFSTFKDYLNIALSENGRSNETKMLIDLISTNKTDFFREPQHFDLFRNQLLPTLKKEGIGFDSELNIWCAASSSGEEPYTIAFFLKEFEKVNPGFRYKFISSDISVRVLKKAITAVYEKDKIEPIPVDYKKKYLLRGKGEKRGLYRVIPEIRNSVKFFRQNLLDKKFEFNENQDIVFCRNVLIYFDDKTKEQIVNNIYNHMNRGGYLILGHAESLNMIDTKFERIFSTVYIKH